MAGTADTRSSLLRLPLLPRTLLLLAISNCIAAVGCATAQRGAAARSGGRVAVLRLKAVGLTDELVQSTRRAIGRDIARTTELELVDAGDVDRAMGASPACAAAAKAGGAAAEGPERQERCALEAGSRLGASHVVVTAVGGLGRTYVVQMRVLDVRKATVTRSLEETRFGAASTLPAAVGQLANRLFGGAARPARPWYGRWWVWTAVAAAVGAAVAVPLAVSAAQRDRYEDVSLP